MTRRQSDFKYMCTGNSQAHRHRRDGRQRWVPVWALGDFGDEGGKGEAGMRSRSEKGRAADGGPGRADALAHRPVLSRGPARSPSAHRARFRSGSGCPHDPSLQQILFCIAGPGKEGAKLLSESCFLITSLKSISRKAAAGGKQWFLSAVATTQVC